VRSSGSPARSERGGQLTAARPKKLFQREDQPRPVYVGHKWVRRDVEHDKATRKVLAATIGDDHDSAVLGANRMKGAKSQSNGRTGVDSVPLVRLSTMSPALMLEFHSLGAFKELR
jgi:hypothetical protein